MRAVPPTMAASASPLVEGWPQGLEMQRRFEVRCAGCAYGGVVERLPDRCPMCGGSNWATVAGPGPRSPSGSAER